MDRKIKLVDFNYINLKPGMKVLLNNGHIDEIKEVDDGYDVTLKNKPTNCENPWFFTSCFGDNADFNGVKIEYILLTWFYDPKNKRWDSK